MTGLTKEWRETNPASKIISAAIIITGIVIIVKNHKRDGFWTGLGAGLLLFGVKVTISK